MSQILPEYPSSQYPFYINRESIGNLFNISYWLWRSNPSSIFPIMLSNTFDVLKQSIIVMALLYCLSQLVSIGFFEALTEAIRKFSFQPLFSFLPQIIPHIIMIIAITICLLLIVSLISSGIVNSAEYGSYLRLIHIGKLSINDVLDEIKKKWAKMVRTAIIVELIKNGFLILVAIWILFDALSLFPKGSLLIMDRFLIWLGALLLGLIITLIFTFLTIYSYPAAAAGFYGFAAIKESIRICKNLPIDTISYILLRGFFNILIFSITFSTSRINIQVSSILIILLGFIITPIFHILKTCLFFKAQPSLIPAQLSFGPSILEDIFPYLRKMGLEKIKKGLHELSFFLKEPRNIIFHFSSALIFFIGIFWGRHISSLGVGEILETIISYTKGENSLFNIYGLPFLALDISFHNWQISLATALSGFIFMFPTITILIFNGFILGVVEDTVQNITMFLAAILPHGIIELPSFIIASSVGLKLGFIFIKALKRGNLSSDPEFFKVLRQTIYITLGLLPLFIIAGIIETFITPLIMSIYGW